MKPLVILFGASLTVATAYSIGSILLRYLQLRLSRAEHRLFACMAGSACLSVILFLVCATHFAHKAAYLALATASIAWAVRMQSALLSDQKGPRLPGLFRWLFLVLFGAFTVFYFFTALAPEVSPDGTTYHLAIVDHYNRAHGFERVPTSIYFNISQGMELLFLMAYAFGKHSAAAMVHFAFLSLLPGTMLSYARRFGFPLAGAAAGLFVYLSPVVGVDGSSAYVDVALAAVVFALYYALQIWDDERQPNLLIVAAILAGFAFALKYTAFVAAIYAIGFVAWKLRPARAARRPLLAMSAIILLFAVPWLAKSWLWVGNPIAPFGNRLFPNPWMHVSFEDDYRTGLQTYDLNDRRQIPLELTVRGGMLSGLFGPLFLLTPLGLIALRWKHGRSLLLAGAVFALPYATNIGTRFLIPAAPFFALALAMVLANWRWVPGAVLIADAVLCWPSMVGMYCAPAAWRMDPELPVLAALRIESEDSFLRRKSPGYVADRMIEQNVPKGGSVFLFGTTAEAYTTRRMLVGFLSAPNEVLRDILLTPLVVDFQPGVLLDFHFPSRKIARLRAVQTESTKEEMWNITEFRVFRDGRELARSPQWRLTAQPNPWDVQLAFDNSPVTRWRTWRAARAGDSVEIDFGEPTEVDEVRLECSAEYTNRHVQLETPDSNDEWASIGGQIVESQRPVDANLRAAATAELKARGVGYLLLYSDDLGAKDFRGHASAWGLTLIAENHDYQLYRIE